MEIYLSNIKRMSQTKDGVVIIGIHIEDKDPILVSANIDLYFKNEDIES